MTTDHRALLGHYKSAIAAFTIAGAVLGTIGCQSRRVERVAVIPETEGTLIWDTAHSGVEEAAYRSGISLYWNAPTREDDMEAQAKLVDEVVDSGKYSGLVLAPCQSYALISPVRRALERRIPTVILSSPVAIPPGNGLINVLNDDQQGGQLAARRVAELLHGHGTVAVLGIDPDIAGILVRATAFEQFLAQNDPNIRIVAKRVGSFNFSHEQQVAEDVLRSNPNLDAIVALMWTSTQGSLNALRFVATAQTRIVGFDIGSRPRFDTSPQLDSVVQQNTRLMGQRAIELLHELLQGHPVTSVQRISPLLITRENIKSPEVQRMLNSSWQSGRRRWSVVE